MAAENHDAYYYKLCDAAADETRLNGDNHNDVPDDKGLPSGRMFAFSTSTGKQHEFLFICTHFAYVLSFLQRTKKGRPVSDSGLL